MYIMNLRILLLGPLSDSELLLTSVLVCVLTVSVWCVVVVCSLPELDRQVSLQKYLSNGITQCNYRIDICATPTKPLPTS